MKRKTFGLFAVPLSMILASCNGGGSPSSSSSSSEPPLPELTITNYKEVPFKVYVFGYVIEAGKINMAYTDYYGEEEGFQGLDSTLAVVGNIMDSGRTIFTKEVVGGLPTYTMNYDWDVTITVDPDEDLITFSDYDAYSSVLFGQPGDVTRSTNPASSKSYSMKPGSYSYLSGGEYTFDLGSYGIDIIQNADGEVYIPSAVVNWLFMAPTGFTAAFNGNGVYSFFDYSSLTDLVNGGLSEFGKEYYASPFIGRSEIPERIAILHGNESMFYLDHFYGLYDLDLYGGDSISEGLRKNHLEYYEGFFSTDPKKMDEAWDWTIRNYLGDNHTSTIEGLGSYYTGTTFERSAEPSQRHKDIFAIHDAYAALREEKLGIPASADVTGDSMFEIHGDMAVIRFDHFLNGSLFDRHSQDEAYFKEHMFTDGYSLFAYSFLQIEKDANIKKVVIDLTLNGGGIAYTCFDMLSFIMDGVPLGIHNPHTGSQTDITLNGNLPKIRSNQNPSYQGSYDIFVMTSGFSFSCGNLFPTVVKATGAATIIGEKSGGGACIVGNAMTPDGMPFTISNNMRDGLCRGSGMVHNDAGITPDVELDSSYFYDLDKLNAKLDEILA